MTASAPVARGPATVPWRSVRRVKLAYYSTRRDRTGGWLQLTIAGDTGTVKIDSRIAGFHRLAKHAAGAARKQGLKVDPDDPVQFSIARTYGG